MKHAPHIEHPDERGTEPVSLIRRSVSMLVNGVMHGAEIAAETGGTVAGRTLRAAGKGVRGFMKGLFHT